MENNEKDILERIFEDGGVPEGASCVVNGGALPKTLASLRRTYLRVPFSDIRKRMVLTFQTI